MKKRKIFLALFLLPVFLAGVIFFRQQDFNQKSVDITKVSSQTNKISQNKSSLLHWSSKLSPNHLYQGDSYTGDYADTYHYYQLFITDLNTAKKQRVYSGDFRTMGWEWTDNSRIKITYNCGTGCRAIRIIDPNENIFVNLDDVGLISKKNGWELKFFKSF